MTREPVVTTASITAGATAVVALLIALGVPISEEVRVALLGVVAVAAPLVVIAARRWTVPAAAVVAHEDADGTVVAGEASELPTGTVIDPDSVDGPEGPDGPAAEHFDYLGH